MRPALAIAFTATLLGLSSCYSMTKEECKAANWQVVGEADGAAGYNPQSRFADHTKSCARIQIVPDQTLWNTGYKAGLVRYCTPLNGLTRGEAGDAYYNVCPPNSAPGFLRGYNLGQRAHEARQRLNDLRSEISSKEFRIDELYSELKETKDPKQADDLRHQIRDLDRDLHWARSNISEAEFALMPIEHDVEMFRANPNMSLPVPGY